MLLLLTGGALIRLVLSEQYLAYVKDVMVIPLLASGAVIALLGLVGWWLATGRSAAHQKASGVAPDPPPLEPDPPPLAPAPPRASGPGHAHGLPAVAWLILLPVMAIYLVPPPALGADAVLRESDLSVAGPAPGGFPPLPTGDPVPLTPRDAVWRVLYDPSSDVLERTVRIDGFAVPGEDGQWYVARISLACCAADGVAYRLLVEGATAPAADEWISVTGRLVEPGGPTAGQPIPRIRAESVEPYTAPVNPYD
jgi:uncharacterized repeat protein (TIGR03943 family)